MADRELGGAEVHTSTHRLLAVLCGGALLTALALGLAEVLLPKFQMGDLPVACAFRRATGVPCPGCGLTRSWVALGRGVLGESLAFHRLGWAIMTFVALQAVRHGAWLVAPTGRPTIDRLGRWLDRSLIVLVIAMFVNWGFTLAAR